MERPSALCEPFEIEKNDRGRGPIRVSREFVTKLNIDDLAGHARKEKLTGDQTFETTLEDIQ